MDFNDFDIERYQKDTQQDFKIVYDVFCAYFLNMLEGKKRDQYLETINKEQALQTNNWINNHIIPFYELLEDYEKCSRLKAVRDYITKVKSLEE